MSSPPSGPQGIHILHLSDLFFKFFYFNFHFEFPFQQLFISLQFLLQLHYSSHHHGVFIDLPLFFSLLLVYPGSGVAFPFCLPSLFLEVRLYLPVLFPNGAAHWSPCFACRGWLVPFDLHPPLGTVAGHWGPVLVVDPWRSMVVLLPLPCDPGLNWVPLLRFPMLLLGLLLWPLGFSVFLSPWLRGWVLLSLLADGGCWVGGAYGLCRGAAGADSVGGRWLCSVLLAAAWWPHDPQVAHPLLDGPFRVLRGGRPLELHVCCPAFLCCSSALHCPHDLCILATLLWAVRLACLSPFPFPHKRLWVRSGLVSLGVVATPSLHWAFVHAAGSPRSLVVIPVHRPAVLRLGM